MAEPRQQSRAVRAIGIEPIWSQVCSLLQKDFPKLTVLSRGIRMEPTLLSWSPYWSSTASVFPYSFPVSFRIKTEVTGALVLIMSSSASLMAQRLKCLPPTQETQVWSLGREDPLEKEMATHSSTLAWRIPWTEETGGLQSTGSQRVGHDWSDLARMHARIYSLRAW